MVDNERNLKMKEWFTFFDKNKEKMNQRYSAIKDNAIDYEFCEKQEESSARLKELSNNGIQIETVQERALQSLSISNLGIYNCDQILLLTDKVYVKADYRDENNQLINANSVVFLIMVINNSVYLNNFGDSIMKIRVL